MTDYYEIVCTDRGQHPERPIGRVSDSRRPPLTEKEREASFSAIRTLIWRRDGTADADARAWEILAKNDIMAKQLTYVSGGTRKTSTGGVRRVERAGLTVEASGTGRTWVLRCQTCKRNPRLSDEQMTRLIDGLKALGVSKADLSLLPF